MSAFLRSPYPHARLVAIDTRPRPRRCRRHRNRHRSRSCVAAGVKPLPLSTDFKRSDGSPTASPPRHALAVGAVRFRRRSRRCGDRAKRRGGARRGRGDRRPLRGAAVVADVTTPSPTGAPLVWPDGDRQRRLPRCATATLRRRDRGVRQGRARRDARPRQPARRAVPDRAARDARELRRSDRPHHAARELPDADRACATRLCAEVLGIATDKVRVLVGDVGGGFGMKTGLYPEDVVLAFARASWSGRSSGAPSGSRNSWPATHGRDRAQQGRAGARRRRPGAGAARAIARQHGRVRDARRRRDPADDRPVGVAPASTTSAPSTSASRRC